MILLLAFAAMILISSGEQMGMDGQAALFVGRNYTADLQRRMTDMNDNINQKIFDIPKVYTLPLDQSPSPLPDPEGFTEDTYEDQTISVKCWRERIDFPKKTVTANFAEITVAHPSQIRTAFAGGSFSSKRSLGSKIARLNNAVVAVNGDFYNYRKTGVIIRNGMLFREVPNNADVLFIDSDGNFSIKNDFDAVQEGYYKQKKMLQALSFGPSLVNNGEILSKIDRVYSICGPYGQEPRSAVGQLGPLHYLICTVDGRSDKSRGVTVHELAGIMKDKNCSVAYNLDGGQSTVLYFHDRLFNRVSDGGERALSDILYFATALPEADRLSDAG